jgi:hypothetical protein
LKTTRNRGENCTLGDFCETFIGEKKIIKKSKNQKIKKSKIQSQSHQIIQLTPALNLPW